MSPNNTASTPLMQQYLKIKAEHKDTILLYRMGDFYETFYDDARLIAKILGIALTKRSHGKSAEVPLAGFPYHALDSYLPQLVKAGHRVAICEQVEDPKLAKGIVKRNVVEIVTPGATLSEKLLDQKRNNFLSAMVFGETNIGLALVDISTGEFYVSEVQREQIAEQLSAFSPKEILIKKDQQELFNHLIRKKLDLVITYRDEWVFNYDYTKEQLIQHYKAHSLKGFGLDKMFEAVIAAGVTINYLIENYKSSLEHLRQPHVLNLSNYMILDEATRQNLEIQSPLRENVGGNTLIAVLDLTQTAMGGRLLKKWIGAPLRIAKRINERLSLVEELFRQNEILNDLQSVLKEIADIERISGKIATGRANGRDLLSLNLSLKQIPGIKAIIIKSGLTKLIKRFTKLHEMQEIVSLISEAITENPPPTITEGNIIRQGYNKELDELRQMAHHGKEWIASLQVAERKRTGIHTLKINYNKVFGYYIEVTKSNLDKIPMEYMRKQTLVNAERFITPALKEQEEKILGAEEKLRALEYEIFQDIRNRIGKQIVNIQQNSDHIATLDVLCSFAEVAFKNNYVRPSINENFVLQIKKGRHPVVEKFMKPGEEFVPNDLFLDPNREQIWMITGPNMAGKSTFLRQVGLIVFMAHIGCFVPADEADVSMTDRIFTRVGASDNLASGESTFLIEMNETANILNNASEQSLVLLDEIGRGTSTFDGLSIAWAVAEYLHNEKNMRAKTLFATHYHELTELAILYPRIKNYNIAVEEWENQIIFLRKIIPGGTDNSYGIHVAQMAGIPFSVIERAREILSNLEANELTPNRMPQLAKRRSGRDVDKNQISLFEQTKISLIEQKLKKLDVDRITPIDALIQLNELKKMVEK